MLNFYVGNSKKLPFLTTMEGMKPKLIYLDPPYNFYERNNYEYEDFLSETLINVRSLIETPCYLVFCTNYKRRKLVDTLIGQFFQTLKLRNEIIWSYNFGVYTRKRFVVSHDTILVFASGTPQFYWEQVAIQSQRLDTKDIRADQRGRTPGDVWDIPRKPGNDLSRRFLKDTKYRSSQPIELCERIVKAYTVPYDLVFDPFMGTGTMARACYYNGRNYIGGDKIEHYVREVKDYFSPSERELRVDTI